MKLDEIIKQAIEDANLRPISVEKKGSETNKDLSLSETLYETARQIEKAGIDFFGVKKQTPAPAPFKSASTLGELSKAYVFQQAIKRASDAQYDKARIGLSGKALLSELTQSFARRIA